MLDESKTLDNSKKFIRITPMLNEFKTFILKGNMIDLAVGIIIGAAFGNVISKFSEFLMSVVGWVLSLAGVSGDARNFDWFDIQGIKIGAVITALINLVLVGFALFIFIKIYNRFKAREEAAPAPPTDEVKLLTEIRDLLQGAAKTSAPTAPSPPESSVRPGGPVS